MTNTRRMRVVTNLGNGRFYEDYDADFDAGYRDVFGYDRRLVEPPKPRVPDATEIRRTFSTTHTKRHIRSGILLPTMNAVKNAIAVYGGGVGALSRTAEAMPDIGGLLLLTVDAQRSRGSFVDRIYRDLDVAFAPEGRQKYHGDWDYDGPGAFHKSGLGVERSGEGFKLRFWGAYTSDRDERLATQLGLEAEFVRAEHDLTWATSGPRWTIPAEALRVILGCVDRQGFSTAADSLRAAFAEHLRQRDGLPVHSDNERPLTWETPSIRLSVDLVNYRARRHYELVREWANLDGEAQAALMVAVEPDGAITGPARMHDRYDPPLPGAVGLNVSLYPRTRSDVPAVLAASEAITEAYANLSPAYLPGE